jgi:NTP-dependent ternary system trypsin peptidase co-occuring protein
MQLPKLISLPDLVKSAADDLRAIRTAEPKNSVMQFAECEVELAVVATAEADGKVKFWVVEAGAGVAYENSQKVKLKFVAIPGQPGIQAPAVAEGTAPLPKRQ